MVALQDIKNMEQKIKPPIDPDALGRCMLTVRPTNRLQGLMIWASKRCLTNYVQFVLDACEEKVRATVRAEAAAGKIKPKDSWIASELSELQAQREQRSNRGFKG